MTKIDWQLCTWVFQSNWIKYCTVFGPYKAQYWINWQEIKKKCRNLALKRQLLLDYIQNIISYIHRTSLCHRLSLRWIRWSKFRKYTVLILLVIILWLNPHLKDHFPPKCGACVISLLLDWLNCVLWKSKWLMSSSGD